MRFLLIKLTLTLITVSGNDLHDRVLAGAPVENGGRITNGQSASIGQFPYHVGLALHISPVSTGWCGGSLIGSTWVLTAAHCTSKVPLITVYLGATFRTVAEVKHTVSRKNIFIHYAWNAATLRNDISLIQIPAVTFSNRIQPVKLPGRGSYYPTYTTDYAIASGWGRRGGSSKTLANQLQWARLQVISNSACVTTYGHSILLSTNMCVSTPNGVSTCNGDSGGPLILESTKVQIGVTSFGAVTGCELGYPVAFTRLTSYLDWIQVTTGISY